MPRDITHELNPPRIALVGHHNKPVGKAKMRTLICAYPKTQFCYLRESINSGIVMAFLEAAQEMRKAGEIEWGAPIAQAYPCEASTVRLAGKAMIGQLPAGSLVVACYDGRPKGTTAEMIKDATARRFMIVYVEEDRART